jgi:quercetin dioxygenase-like cupin family protein
MNQWDLLTADGGDRSGPRVLFSTPEARGLVVDLAKDQELGDHQVRERALVQVLRGSVMCTSGADNATCAEGTLVVFDPGEPHSVRALEPALLLVVLAPWPADGHYDAAEEEDPHELPVHATQPPRNAGAS